jgi:hypothetical protein
MPARSSYVLLPHVHHDLTLQHTAPSNLIKVAYLLSLHKSLDITEIFVYVVVILQRKMTTR